MSEEVQPDFGMSPDDTTYLLRLFATHSDAFQRRIEELATVNPTDRIVMEMLIERGPQSPSELAVAASLTPAAMTTSVDRLEALGHARRTPHPHDRRKVVVTATPESTRTIMGEVLAMVRDVDAVTKEFTENELATVRRFLTRVNEVYARHNA